MSKGDVAAFQGDGSSIAFINRPFLKVLSLLIVNAVTLLQVDLEHRSRGCR